MSLLQVQDPVLVIALNIGLYIGSQLLTFWISNLYRKFPTPIMTNSELGNMRAFSPRSRTHPLVSIALIIFARSYADMMKLPVLFTFFAGYTILFYVPVYNGLLQNFWLLRSMQTPGVVEGRLDIARWVILRNNAANLAFWGILFVALSVLTESWFFVGGAVYTLLIALRKYTSSIMVKRRS